MVIILTLVVVVVVVVVISHSSLFPPGVYFQEGKENPWLAAIKIDHKLTYVGKFANEDEAAHAYDAAVRKYHRHGGVTNFDLDGKPNVSSSSSSSSSSSRRKWLIGKEVVPVEIPPYYFTVCPGRVRVPTIKSTYSSSWVVVLEDVTNGDL